MIRKNKRFMLPTFLTQNLWLEWFLNGTLDWKLKLWGCDVRRKGKKSFVSLSWDWDKQKLGKNWWKRGKKLMKSWGKIGEKKFGYFLQGMKVKEKLLFQVQTLWMLMIIVNDRKQGEERDTLLGDTNVYCWYFDTFFPTIFTTFFMNQQLDLERQFFLIHLKFKPTSYSWYFLYSLKL